MPYITEIAILDTEVHMWSSDGGYCSISSSSLLGVDLNVLETFLNGKINPFCRCRDQRSDGVNKEVNIIVLVMLFLTRWARKLQSGNIRVNDKVFKAETINVLVHHGLITK